MRFLGFAKNILGIFAIPKNPLSPYKPTPLQFRPVLDDGLCSRTGILPEYISGVFSPAVKLDRFLNLEALNPVNFITTVKAVFKIFCRDKQKNVRSSRTIKLSLKRLLEFSVRRAFLCCLFTA